MTGSILESSLSGLLSSGAWVLPMKMGEYDPSWDAFLSSLPSLPKPLMMLTLAMLDSASLCGTSFGSVAGKSTWLAAGGTAS